MSTDNFVSVDIDDFSDEGIGRCVLEFIARNDTESLRDFIAEAASRDVAIPVVEVRVESSLYELITAVASAVAKAMTVSVNK